MRRPRHGLGLGRRLTAVALLSAVGLLLLGNRSREPAGLKLVLVVVVDQMRADMLDRYGASFNGGFARLVREGANFTNAHHGHVVTATAVGHAAIATGVHPARHGIVGNNWYERAENAVVYAVEDVEAPLVGDTAAPGRSPRLRLKHPTLGDRLKEQSPQSKVFSVSMKDRAAVVMGGMKPDGAYWYHPDARGFTTSTYYRPAIPPWVDSFNTSGLLESFFAAGWPKLLAEEAYGASREDSFPIENNGKDFVFPHPFPSDSGKIGQAYYEALQYTPFGDIATLQFVETLIAREGVGTDDVVDILWLSLSTTDRVGHAFGPYSQEVQDAYVRLDRALGTLLAALDRAIGSDQYAVVLTSDHGAIAAPEELQRHGVPGARRIDRYDLQSLLQTAITGAFDDVGVTNQPRVRFLPYSDNDGGLILVPPAAGDMGASVRDLQLAIADRLRQSELVGGAFAAEALEQGEGSKQEFFDVFRRSYYPGRSPDIAFYFRENHMFTAGANVATHGSPFDYDTHIPLIFRAPGLLSQQRANRVLSIDIAPTVARWLGITSTEWDGTALKDIAGR